MYKKVLAVSLVLGLGLSCVAIAQSQESQRWKSGAGMITDLVRSPRRVGISEVAVIPDVITVGTNAAIQSGKFYVLQVPNNWVLADGSAAATSSGMIGYAYGSASPTTPSAGMIIGGKIVNAAWADLPIGTALYVGTAGALSSTAGSYVRFVGYIVADSTLQFIMKDVSSVSSTI